MGAIPFLQALAGDIDLDDDVDIDDFDLYLVCTAGPDVTDPPAGCSLPEFARADLDDDTDVDFSDLAGLQRQFGESLDGSQPGACCLLGNCFVAESEALCTNNGGGFAGEGTTCDETMCAFWSYRNETELTIEYYQPGAGVSIADDMTLSGTGARELTYYDLLVYAFDGPPFGATVELWDGCPGEGGEPIPGTGRIFSDLPLNATTPISAVFDNIPIPETVWMVVTMTTDQAGWFVANEPEHGSTAVTYAEDEEPWNCEKMLDSESFGGFWANIRCGN